MSFNDFNNLQFYQPAPATVIPTAGSSGDSKALDDLSRQLSNPELLKDGAQGALMGLLVYAAELCRQNQQKVRSLEASESSDLATAQGQTAGAQADAIKASAYAAAGGMVGSAAASLGGAGLSSYKGMKDNQELVKKGKDIDALNKDINNGAATQTGPAGSNKQELMDKKVSLERDYHMMQGSMQQHLHTIGRLGEAGSTIANAGGQITSAQGKASETLLGTAQQQQSQTAQNLASAEQTASDVAKDLANLETIAGQASKAAVGS